MNATVIGGGLAGCEAAWALANRGVRVTLYEMKPIRYSPAHKSPDLAELVCSNSLKAARIGSAAGLLKEEMRRLGSLCMAVADACAVPAGGALAVDRDAFARGVTNAIEEHPLITLVREGLELEEGDFVADLVGPLGNPTRIEKYGTVVCAGGQLPGDGNQRNRFQAPGVPGGT